jgi:hypothetical protein
MNMIQRGFRVVGVAVGYTACAFLSPSVAAQFDPAVLARWGSVEVLKYKVVASFSGDSPVVIGGNGSADVTDRYELEFRWNQYNAELVGDPVVRNFPSEAANVHGPGGCDTPELTGSYELATVLTATLGYGGYLHLNVRNELAPAIAPINCSGSKGPTPGQISEQIVQLPILGIAMWGLPAEPGSDTSASGDTLTVKDGDWTLVYTLSKG